MNRDLLDQYIGLVEGKMITAAIKYRYIDEYTVKRYGVIRPLKTMEDLIFFERELQVWEIEDLAIRGYQIEKCTEERAQMLIRSYEFGKRKRVNKREPYNNRNDRGLVFSWNNTKGGNTSVKEFNPQWQNTI